MDNGYIGLLEQEPRINDTTTKNKAHTSRCCCRVSKLRCAFVTLFSVFLLIGTYYLFMPMVVTHLLSMTNLSFSGVSMDDHRHRPTHPSFTRRRLSQPPLPLSSSTHHNSFLTLTAHCQIHGMALPFDIGIIAPYLNVYTETNERLGHLVPLNSETTVYKKNNGSFSLLASLRIDNLTSFHQFAGHLLQDNAVAWRLKDDNGISIRLQVPFFGTHLNLYVPSVHLNKTVVMKGCNAFKNTTLELFYLDDLPSNQTGGDKPGLNVHMTARVYNPSTANVTDMGRIHFDMFYSVPEGPTRNGSNGGNGGNGGQLNHPSTLHPKEQRIQLGYLETDESLSVAPGWNTLKGTGRFNAEGDLANVLIHNFMMGIPTVLAATAPMSNARYNRFCCPYLFVLF